MAPDQLAFDVVDVFAESPYAGNQLAVVHGGADLTDAQRLAIAQEFGYSETTFPTARSRSAYDVRILTPSAEIPFAGHPTLGTAWVLRERGEIDGGAVVQHCGAGEVRVAFDGDWVELSATPSELAGPLPEPLVHAILGDHGLAPGDLAGEAWVAGCGLGWTHVPVVEEALGRARLGTRRLETYDGWPVLRDLCDGVNLVAVTQPARVGGPVDVHARVFVPGLLGAEDAATGSAAAGLGMALVARGVLPDGGGYRIRQGVEMGRPSRLTGRVDATDGRATACHVSGQVHAIARGTLKAPPA
ncbi:PhzF family phenazine biosynthesis protein [Nocardioides guangzhouensis]|uniref:PhzF family phenazine biosynthesis protein n=1 Tax=Nocardioides guangzhouensis TaxID=2497878 RepID=A0A4Q4ZJC1_9ACTN|nr:PhzF family phenazine biosynthesis protein [Nocardioides guangzhouensis]RYP88422.1 PhzF family phenazine biosynthesis protein [Nocardioides guangzhouensis]